METDSVEGGEKKWMMCDEKDIENKTTSTKPLKVMWMVNDIKDHELMRVVVKRDYNQPIQRKGRKVAITVQIKEG